MILSNFLHAYVVVQVENLLGTMCFPKGNGKWCGVMRESYGLIALLLISQFGVPDSSSVAAASSVLTAA
uniref:Uncharacterized protein n=1 Tax=Knipowitschia caucasica TaxID=637954 RepID=A0AAV2MNE1_KNICA